MCVLALALGGAVDALATEDPDAVQEEEELQVYEKHNPLLHGSKKAKYEVYFFFSIYAQLHIGSCCKAQFCNLMFDSQS